MVGHTSAGDRTAMSLCCALRNRVIATSGRKAFPLACQLSRPCIVCTSIDMPASGAWPSLIPPPPFGCPCVYVGRNLRTGLVCKLSLVCKLGETLAQFAYRVSVCKSNDVIAQ